MANVDNNRIAVSLLRQCAWLWEHCMTTEKTGCFRLADIIGKTARWSNIPQSEAAGKITIDLERCKYWDTFNRYDPIEGLTYNREWDQATLEFLDADGNGFRCSYPLEGVLDVTRQFCKWNAPAMANKVRFCCNADGERWAELPGLPAEKKAKAKAVKPRATIRAVRAAEPTPEQVLAERLRQALQLAMAA